MRNKFIYSFVPIMVIGIVVILLIQWYPFIFYIHNASLDTRYEVENLRKEENRKNESSTLTQAKSDNGFKIDFGYTDEWSIFSTDNDSLFLRRFSFKYPSIFQIENAYTNSRVWLKKDDQYLLGIEETFPLTEFYLGSTQDEKFISYYFFKKNVYKDYPKLEFERISLGENNFLYKVVEDDEDMRFGKIFTKLENWNRYLGVIDNKGIDVVDLKRLPDDLVLTILRSIQFK